MNEDINASRFENILQQSLSPLIAKLNAVESSVVNFTDRKNIADLRNIVDYNAESANKKLVKTELEIQNWYKLLEDTTHDLQTAKNDFENDLAIKNDEIVKLNNKINDVDKANQRLEKLELEINNYAKLLKIATQELETTKSDFERQLAVKNEEIVKLADKMSKMEKRVVGVENLYNKSAIAERKFKSNENNWVSPNVKKLIIIIVSLAIVVASLVRSYSQIVDIENFKNFVHTQKFTENGVEKELIYPTNGDKRVHRADAINLCAKYNATLIDIESREKQKRVEGFLTKINQIDFYWTGGSLNAGKYKWLTTGNEFQYTNWHPEWNTDNTKPYTFIYSDVYNSEDHGKWFTISSDRVLRVICEKVITNY